LSRFDPIHDERNQRAAPQGAARCVRQRTPRRARLCFNRSSHRPIARYDRRPRSATRRAGALAPISIAAADSPFAFSSQARGWNAAPGAGQRNCHTVGAGAINKARAKRCSALASVDIAAPVGFSSSPSGGNRRLAKRRAACLPMSLYSADDRVKIILAHM
jgi:hypothetical protein